MLTGSFRRLSAALAVALAVAGLARAQFLDPFEVTGRTLGLAIRPLGVVVASFRAGPGGDGGGGTPAPVRRRGLKTKEAS